MKKLRKALALILSMCMLLSLAQTGLSSVFAEQDIVSQLQFAVMSDLHYYPESLFTDSEAWRGFCYKDGKEYSQSEQLIGQALEGLKKRAERTGLKYLFIPGDLTKDSEYQAHVELAAMLEQFERESGVSVIVTDGNHDINNDKACSFASGKKEPARSINAAEFREVYKNLGFDLADSFYVPKDGTTQGMLSYSVKLEDGYRLIVGDTCKYDAVNPRKYDTSGTITDGLLSWIKAEAQKAYSEGDVPFIMTHHSLAPHMKIEPSVTFAFCIDDYQRVSEELADSGINFGFTGHLHTNDIASVISDSGNAIYDCETPSITGYPNKSRHVTAKTDSKGVTSLTFDTVDIDGEQPITVDGVTYSNGEFAKKSFSICYGGFVSENGYANTADFLMGVAESFGDVFIKEVADAGGILAYLKTIDLDLESIIAGFLEPYIGDGIKLGGYNIFSVENIMWFLGDLLGQLDELYIKNPQLLWDIVRPAVENICNLQVSEVPCTKFIDTLNFGDATKGGTLGDCILSCLYYWCNGNENIYDENDPDLFMQDAIKQLRGTETVKKLFDILVDFVFNDVVDEALLSKLEIRLDRLLGNSVVAKNLGNGINYLLSYVLRNDFTYKNLVDTVFALGVLPYTSVFDVVDKLAIQEYLTDSQFESIGYLAAYFLEDFSTDFNPIEKGDYDVTYTSAPVPVPATRENFRLPTMVSVTMGEDSETSANINWFSKYTLSAADIEIYKAQDESPMTKADFSGKATENADFTIDTESKLVERFFPGVDLGVIGFLNYFFDMYQHTVRLSGLERGTKYYYRVGNAERSWWSDVGCIETADGSDRVTFFHMTDPQSQNEAQYKRAWANVVDKAFDIYPEAKFIASTGDLVDCGMNNNQWQWMFDTASDELMSTYLMPATGNHEERDDHSTVNNFVLPNVPEQDTATGVYYSYEYNNVLVMVLNTNDLDKKDALNETQLEWLKKTASESDAEWKIVALHKALYSNGTHYDDDDVCAFRDQLGGLLPELDVDMVLQGHDHVYLRTYSLIDNQVSPVEYDYLVHGNDVYKTQVTPEGTTYVISGTCGIKTYQTKDVTLTDEYFPRAQKIYNAEYPVFSAIEIEDGILYFTAYIVDGDNCTVVDKFAIQKDVTQGEKASDFVEELDDNGGEAKDQTLQKILTVIQKIVTVLLNIFKIYVLRIKLS